MMNEKAFNSSFIIPHSSFLTVSPARTASSLATSACRACGRCRGGGAGSGKIRAGRAGCASPRGRFFVPARLTPGRVPVVRGARRWPRPPVRVGRVESIMEIFGQPSSRKNAPRQKTRAAPERTPRTRRAPPRRTLTDAREARQDEAVWDVVGPDWKSAARKPKEPSACWRLLRSARADGPPANHFSPSGRPRRRASRREQARVEDACVRGE